jgi:hypothetical protein
MKGDVMTPSDSAEQRPQATRAQRTLLLAILLNATGTGLYIASAPIYLTRAVGLSDAQAALGFTIGSAVGLAFIAPLGYLSDRIGAKSSYIIACVTYMVAMVGFAFVTNLTEFTLVACVTGTSSAASASSRPALVRQLAGDRLRWLRTRNRQVNNLGMGLGALGAVAALGTGSLFAYRSIYLINAASYVICAAFILMAVKAAGEAPARRPSTRKWMALRDRQFIRGTVLNGILALQYPVLTFAIPLWAVNRIGAPAWIASAVLVVNTTLIATLQSRLGRSIRSLSTAGQALRRCGVVFTANLVLVAFAPFLPWLEAAALLIAAVVLHSLAEALHASASQEVYYGLASADSQAEYAGVFWIGQGLALTVGPALLAFLCLGVGTVGWLVLAAVFLLTGLASPFILGAAPEAVPASA